MAVSAINNEKIDDVVKRFVRYGKSYIPNSEFADIYNEKYDTYKKLRDFSLSFHKT